MGCHARPWGRRCPLPRGLDPWRRSEFARGIDRALNIWRREMSFRLCTSTWVSCKRSDAGLPFLSSFSRRWRHGEPRVTAATADRPPAVSHPCAPLASAARSWVSQPLPLGRKLLVQETPPIVLVPEHSLPLLLRYCIRDYYVYSVTNHPTKRHRETKPDEGQTQTPDACADRVPHTSHTDLSHFSRHRVGHRSILNTPTCPGSEPVQPTPCPSHPPPRVRGGEPVQPTPGSTDTLWLRHLRHARFDLAEISSSEITSPRSPRPRSPRRDLLHRPSEPGGRDRREIAGRTSH